MKLIMLLLMMISMSFGSVGTLRIIADFGQKENLSTTNCTASPLSSFPFLNDDKNDTIGPSIIKQSSLSSYNFCSPALNSGVAGDTGINSIPFKPTLIFFNDKGLKGVPTLFNKRLLTSSSLNKILYSYLLDQSTPTGTVGSTSQNYTQNFFTELSKFSPEHFYFSLTYDMYEKLVIGGKKDAFFTFLDNASNVIKMDEVSKKVFAKKVTFIKDIFNFSFDIYNNALSNYTTISTVPKLDLWQSGMTQKSFCPSTGDACYNCLATQNIGSDCSAQCSGVKGYEQCGLTSSTGPEITACMMANCINTSLFASIDSYYPASANTRLSSILRFLSARNNANYNSLLTNPMSSQYMNFRTIPFKHYTTTIENSDGSINVAETEKKRNILCRTQIEENISSTFQYYANDFKFNSTTYNLSSYPSMNLFDNIMLDIHRAIPTHNIVGLINEVENATCYAVGNYAGFNNQTTIINYSNILKFNGTSFVHFSNKITGQNLKTGLNEIQQDSGFIGSSVPVDGASPSGGSFNTNPIGITDPNAGNMTPSTGTIPVSNGTGTIATTPLSTTDRCGENESVVVIFFDSMSNTIDNPTMVNQKLNTEISKSSNFFDIENYNTYIGCYKNGYIVKFFDRYKRATNDATKDKALLCYNKWENEPEEVPLNSVTYTNVAGACFDYFYTNVNDSSLLSLINQRFYDKTVQDNVVFGSILHSNVYNESALYTSGNSTDQKPIFKNNINTIPHNDYHLKAYSLKETLCTKISDPYVQPAPAGSPAGTPGTFIKGEYECINYTATQKMMNHEHTYQYSIQGYMPTINSYTPISLSSMPTLLASNSTDVLNIKDNTISYAVTTPYTTTKQCYVIYNNNSDITIPNYLSDMQTCLNNVANGEVYSDYNTLNQTTIRSYFPTLYNDTVTYAQNNVNLNLTGTMNETTLFSSTLQKSGLYLLVPVFKTLSNGYTPNDMMYYEVEQNNIQTALDTFKSL